MTRHQLFVALCTIGDVLDVMQEHPELADDARVMGGLILHVDQLIDLLVESPVLEDGMPILPRSLWSLPCNADTGA